jgi:hypothetical protein
MDTLLLVAPNKTCSSRYDILNYTELNINVGKPIFTINIACINIGS